MFEKPRHAYLRRHVTMRGPARSVGRSSRVSSRWHGTVSALLVLLVVPVQFAHAQPVGRYVRLILAN